MEPTEIELYSDAVKIGFPVLGTVLGAIIGGVSTYFLAKLNHKNNSKVESQKRRIDLLMTIASDVSEFEHLVGQYATAVSNEVRGAPNPLDVEECRLALSKENIHVRKVRVNLKLLGLAKAEALLEEYLELTRELIRKGTRIEADKVSDMAKKIARGPVKFYEELGSEFTSNK